MVNKQKGLNPMTDTPMFDYQLTPEFMLGYIQRDDVPEEKKKDFAQLCMDNRKRVRRRHETIDILNTTPIRLWFANEFFPRLLELKKEKVDSSFFDTIEELLK